MSKIQLAEGAAASTPASGKAVIYAKTDGKIYSKDDAGSETDLTAGAAGGLDNIVEDVTPQLGGDLDLNSKGIDFPTTANVTDCLDEDDMVSDSATVLATQQSIKKYVDDNSGGTVDTSGTPAANDIARFTDADTIEGRSYAEVKADLSLEIGTDVLAEQTIGIADNNLMEVDDADAASTDYARFTATGLQGRDATEVKTDLGLVIGTNVLAEQTIGIADDNLLEVDDADAADNDFAKFTANGLEGRSYAETLSDIGAAAALGADDNYVTDAEKTVIGNTSGANTGDEVAANLTTAGVIEIATGAETNTGTDATRAVSPDGLDDWTGSAQITTVGTLAAGDADAVVSDANLTTKGKVELATGTETNTGTDATRAVTPDGLDDWTGSAQITTVGTLSSGDVTAQVSASNTTTAGKIEVATAAETTTGTDAGRAVSPDGLAGSDFGIRPLEVTCFDYTTDCATGDGAGYVTVPDAYDGMNLVAVHARCITAGTTGTMDIQVHNLTQTADMLSTVITIDTTPETGSDTAATPAVIDAANDDVAAYDLIRIDVDVIHTTAAKGLIVTLEFQLP